MSPVEFALALALFTALVLALEWVGDRRVRWAVIVLLLVLIVALAGCARQPAPLPEPPTLPAPIVCAVPPEMIAREPVPLAPHGTESQREVALYLLELHRWGSRGWQRLEAVRDYTERCRDGAETTDVED